MKKYKITLFGDSIPKGVYLENGKVKNLKLSAVNIIENNLGIKIEDKSIFGQTLLRVHNKGLINNYLENININENNLVVFSLGGNDADFNWKEVSAKPCEKHSSKTMLEDFCSLLNFYVIKLKSKNVKVILTSLPPINAERFFENVVILNNNKKNILKFLNNDISNLTRNHEAFNIAILKIADKNNCRFIDFRTAMLQQVDYLNMLCEDGIHPNESGQKFIAEYILDDFKKNPTF